MILKDVLESDPVCADILEKAYAVPALKQVVETRTTALHVSTCKQLLYLYEGQKNKQTKILVVQ